jgi:hypothetical protein
MDYKQGTKDHLRQLAKTLNVAGVQAVLVDPLSNAGTVAQCCNSLRALALDRRTLREDFIACIGTVTNRMVEFQWDATVQKCSLMMLAALAEKKELSSDIGNSRCLGVIMDSWAEHFQDRNLVKDVLVTLRSLTLLEGTRIMACDLGAIESTIQAMKEFGSHASIQSQSLALLCNLSFGSDEAKLKVSKAGGADVTVAAMRTFKSPKEVHVQLKACMFLRSMSSAPIPSENALVISGALDCLIHTLEAYRRDAEVLEQAILALTNIARSAPTYVSENRRNVSMLASSAQIFSATHSQGKRYVRVHDALLSLLLAMAIDKEHVQAEMGKNGSLRSIIISVSHHIRNAEPPVSSPSSAIVVRRAAALFRCLSFVPGNRKIIAEHEHGISVLLGCIRVLRRESLQAENALLALANAIFDSPVGKASVHSCKGIETVVEMMKEHLHESGIQEACLLSIRAVCDGSHSNSKEITKLGAHMLCNEVMARFAENAVLQEHAMAVFIVLLQNGASFSKDESRLIVRAADLATKTFPFSIALLAQRELLEKLLLGDLHGKDHQTASETPAVNERTVSIGKVLGRKQLSVRRLRSRRSLHLEENVNPPHDVQ